jgi:hypothetical protein
MALYMYFISPKVFRYTTKEISSDFGWKGKSFKNSPADFLTNDLKASFKGPVEEHTSPLSACWTEFSAQHRILHQHACDRAQPILLNSVSSILILCVPFFE